MSILLNVALFSDYDDDEYRANGYVCEKLIYGCEDGNAIRYNHLSEHVYGEDRCVCVDGCVESLHVGAYGNGPPLPIKKHRLS